MVAHNIDYTPTRVCGQFMADNAKMRVLMGPVGCIAGDTEIVTEQGLVPIADITASTRVLSWNARMGRFELSQSGGGYPKGRDYLYRVTTLQGSFVAAGFHQVLDAANKYRRVDSLGQGQSLSLCFGNLQGIASEPAPLALHGGDPGLTQTVVDYLGRYAASVRQYGLPLLRGPALDQGTAPLLGGVPVSPINCGLASSEQLGDYLVHPLEHIHPFRCDGLPHTGGSPGRDGHPRLSGVGHEPSSPSAHSGGLVQQALRSLWKTASHLTKQLFSLCSRSYLYSLSDRTILSIERLDVRQEYWDLQVLDTNNYVTADGTIHHNSGKSVTSTFEVIRRAGEQEPNEHGIRKSRAAVVRETARQLMDTTIKTFLDWFPPGVCGRYMRTTKTYFFSVGDIECEIMFRALDDADDVANLNSLELTFAWFNECQDIHPDIIDAMSKRVGRFPSKKDGGPTWWGMWGDTNPPTMDTWWYYQMEHLDPEDGVSANDNGWGVYKQPSGRSALAENIENLPEGYYDTQGRSEEYIRTYIDGEYGLSSAGQPVYKYFRPDYHMASEHLTPILNGVRPLVVGMDLGLTPAAVIGQADPRGRALIYAEAVSFDMGVQRFARTVLKPLLFERFSGANVMIVVDPAGVQRAQTDERSAIDILKQEGFKVIPAKTNNVTPRLNAVDEYLMRHADGDSAFLVDPSCMALKSAMMGGYRFHPKTGAIEKNKHSHVAEALQYLMLHIASISDGAIVSQRREVKPLSAAGWT